MREQKDNNPKKPLTAAERQRRLRQRRRLDNPMYQIAASIRRVSGAGVSVTAVWKQSNNGRRRWPYSARPPRLPPRRPPPTLSGALPGRSARRQRRAEAAEQLAAQLAEMGFKLGHAYGFGWGYHRRYDHRGAPAGYFRHHGRPLRFLWPLLRMVGGNDADAGNPDLKGRPLHVRQRAFDLLDMLPQSGQGRALGVDAKIAPGRQK